MTNKYYVYKLVDSKWVEVRGYKTESAATNAIEDLKKLEPISVWKIRHPNGGVSYIGGDLE